MSTQLTNHKIDLKYLDLLPRPTAVEQSRLRSSIQENGQLNEIVINSNGVILDGHARYKICQDLGITPKTITKAFDSKFHECEYIIRSNTERRELSPVQKWQIGQKLLPYQKELARQRQSDAGKYGKLGGRGNKALPKTVGKGNRHSKETSAVLANSVGLSRGNYEKISKIMNSDDEFIKNKLINGNYSINTANLELIKSKMSVDPCTIPKGEYSLFYVDPPYEYKSGVQASPNHHYPTMTTSELCDIRLPTAKKSVIFQWATSPKIPDALEIMKAWGFTYKSKIIWDKLQGEQGHYTKVHHEELLIGTKGKIGTPRNNSRPLSIIRAPLLQHSEKPEIFRRLIMKMYPNQRNFEMFARKYVDGWTSCGNQIGGKIK